MNWHRADGFDVDTGSIHSQYAFNFDWGEHCQFFFSSLHFFPSRIPSVKFLADTYLKYIGWMLYDKVGEVRMACLNVLEPLYSDPDTAPHLELFTEKFKVSRFSNFCLCVRIISRMI